GELVHGVNGASSFQRFKCAPPSGHFNFGATVLFEIAPPLVSRPSALPGPRDQVRQCLLWRRRRGTSGHNADIPDTTRLTRTGPTPRRAGTTALRLPA